MSRLRRIALTVVVGVLVTLPTVGASLTDFDIDPGASVLVGVPGLTQISPRAVPADTDAAAVAVNGDVAAEGAPLFFLDGRTL